MSANDERVWDAVNKLQQGQAKHEQALLGIQKSLEDLNNIIRQDIDRGHKVHEEHAVELAKVKKDVDAVGEKQREHETSHWRWAAFVVSIGALLVAGIELVSGFFRKGNP